MKRATQLFVFEERASGTPLVERLWRTRSEPVETFISVAESHWEIVFTREKRESYVTVRGPEATASTAPIPQDAQFFGIQFRRGAFMPGLPVEGLVDGSITLPEATGTSFWLNGSAWGLPNYENADVFVNRLVREGLLVRDPVVEDALEGHFGDRSLRSIQRRVLRATGLTLTGIRQIDRAQKAAALLDQGVSIAETIGLTGYADQPHLTRSLKRFVGQTPREIIQREPSAGS
jgi:AraC-like DNA-binding protein